MNGKILNHLRKCNVNSCVLFNILSVYVNFKDRDGNVKKVAGKVGDNAMYLAHRYKIDIEGACEASCACSTCHVFVKDEFLNKLPDASDEENDMLDQAPCLKLNSRLGKIRFEFLTNYLHYL